MRRVFLWAARNSWLKTRLPRFRFMKRAVRRFMPGETLDSALDAAAPLEAAGIGTMYTRLGENLASLDEADEVADHYIAVFDADRRPAAIAGRCRSSRPSSASITIRTERSPTSRAWPRRPRRPARTSGSTWRAATTSRRRSRCTSGCAPSSPGRGSASRPTSSARPPMSSGCARSTRRSASSRARTTSRSRSPTATSARSTPAISPSRSTSSRRGRGHPIRLGLGTHDVALIEQIAEQVDPAGVPKDGFEVEMLYGIRAREQYRLVKAGYRVQTLIAYGEAWYPWYMRRLAERPANVAFALRSLLP